MTDRHETFMLRCIDLAKQAQALSYTPVGALVVLENAVIAEAHEAYPNSLDVTAHAEIRAIQNACRTLNSLSLDRCTLYTTAEPCWMCSYAIRETGIVRVVIGAPTPDVGGISSQHPLLIDDTITVWATPPEIVSGVLEEQCRGLYRL